MTFTQCHAECIFMFGSLSKKIKVSTAAHAIDITSVKVGDPKKTHSHNNKKTWQVQTELIEQQKQEIEKLKAAQASGINPQQFMKDITQAMSCMYVGAKKLASTQETGEKPYLGTARPPKLSKGLDGSLDPNLSCQY